MALRKQSRREGELRLNQLRDLAVTFRYSESVREVQKHPAGTLTILESGKKIPADTVRIRRGQGVTDAFNVGQPGTRQRPRSWRSRSTSRRRSRTSTRSGT